MTASAYLVTVGAMPSADADGAADADALSTHAIVDTSTDTFRSAIETDLVSQFMLAREVSGRDDIRDGFGVRLVYFDFLHQLLRE